MKKLIVTCLTALFTAGLSPSALAANFSLDQVTDVVAPSTRGEAGTTWFGWETFNDAGLRAQPINDSTPDIGTTSVGVNFSTTNGEDHVLDSGNLYFPPANTPTLYEQVTVATSGTVGSGFTTVIAQFVTAGQDFAGPITVSSINGVLPTVVRGVNAAGKGQVWAKWQIPGNAASYVFTLTGPVGTADYSIDRLVVDTYWNALSYQPDVAQAAPTFALDEQPGLIAPTTRGSANTTYFGWNTFTDGTDYTVVIDDSTPDIGTALPGMRFRTTNAEDHLAGSNNYYSGGLTMAEEVTVVTSGTVGTGYTTIIAQGITSFGGFTDPITFGTIAGVTPTVVQGTNTAGQGMVWAKWRIPGNAANYTFTMSSPTGSIISFDRFIVDTSWNDTAYQTDLAVTTSGQIFTLDRAPAPVTPTTRGATNTTYFGWDNFTDTDDVTTPIDDSSPDIGSAVGARFRTTNGQDHLSMTKNYYSGFGSAAEEVTVVTNGVVGTGFTTIIAQGFTSTGGYPAPIAFGAINGVNPTVVQGTNSIGRGQVWAKWRVPGNAASYTFTISAPAEQPISFDRFIVDTSWNATTYQGNTARTTTPAVARVMPQVAGVVTPGTRGSANTTWFGWETFNNTGARAVPIDDSTPDIGNTTTAGARFQTTNSEVHMLPVGNLYFFEGTLAERITVPTNGTVGSTGFTTIILQIASAPGFADFAETISLSSINDVAPTIVQAPNSGASAQLWAIWKVPGNQATYTIDIAGPPGQAHFSFDRVVVDTEWTARSLPADSMAELPVSLTSASPLAFGGVDSSYSAQLAGAGGTAPYTYSTTAGTLPAGVTLSTSGLLSGTPTTVGVSNFTVQISDANGLLATKAFELTVTTSPSITTASPLPAHLVNTVYSLQLEASGGTSPYTWTVSSGTPPTGLTLSTAGLLSGTPTVAAASNFTVQITDSNGLVKTKAFDLAITTSPSITTATALTNGMIGVAYSTPLEASGGTSPYTWTLSSGTLPAGLTLSTAGVLSGTPTAAGASNFTVQVSDANSFTATKAFSVTFQDLVISNVSPLPGAVKAVPYSYTFTGTGGTTPYTWAITAGNAPAGLTLTAGVLSGTPTLTGTTPVVSNFTVRMTDVNSFAITKNFTLTVFPSYQKPVVNAITFGTTTIGAPYGYTVSATNYPKTFAITGLPKGLTFVAATGVISGRPSVSGLFNVQVKATNTGGTSTVVTAPLVVKALATNLVGTFTGIIGRNVAANTNLGSRLTLTTTLTGSYTAKVTTGATTTAVTGYLATTTPQVSVAIAGNTLTLTLANSLITGTHGAGAVTGWRQVWDKIVNPASDLAGYYSVALDLANIADDGVVSIPQGSGYATFSVLEAGTLTVAGKTADGQAITSAGFIGPNGDIAVYTPLYTNKGSIVGKLNLVGDAGGLFIDNTVSGQLTWSKPTTVTKAYATAFGPITLNAYGKYLAPAATGNVVLGLPDTGTANVALTDGGLSESATDPDASFTYTDDNKVVIPANPSKTTVTINQTNGLVGGKFTLTDGSLVRNVTYQGQIVRLANGSTKAVGYFLLPQKPGVGQTAANAPILSGGVAIQQQ